MAVPSIPPSRTSAVAGAARHGASAAAVVPADERHSRSAPVALALAGFALGVIGHLTLAHLPSLPAAIAAVSAGVLAGCMVVLHMPRARFAATSVFQAMLLATVAAAAGGTGLGYASWRAQVRLADELPVAWEGVDVAIVGVVDDLPQTGDRGTRFAFAVERSETPGAVVPSRLSLGWYAPANADDDAPAPAVHAGERWRLVVRLKRPHGTVNPAGFDLEAWLLEHNLRATGSVVASAPSERIDPFAGRFDDYVQRAREAVRARIQAALPGAPYAGVLVALAIGDQRAIPEVQWLVFNRTGVSHLISISGLHVTAFAALAGAGVLALVRRVPAITTRLPARKVAVALGALLAAGYVLLAGAEVPAVRTLAMLGVAAVGVWLARPGTALCVWLWSLVVVLLLDPWAAFAPGFWLSFGAVGMLLYAGAGRLEDVAPKGFGQRLAHGLGEAARTQWAVTIGLVPGTLALFQQVSLVSAVANAVAIPTVTALVVPLALAGLVVPWDALWLVAHAVLALLMILLEALADLPSAAWASHAPSPAALAVALGGVALLLAARGVPGRWLGWVWLAPMVLVMPARPPPASARIVALDIGQGTAVLVETASHTLVYDTGPRYTETTDAGGRVLVPVLRALGVRSLDALVVSHQDLDHSGGALSLLAAVPTKMLWSSLPVEHAIVGTASTAGTAWRCTRGQAWTWDGVRFEFLHPPLEHYTEADMKTNDRSCVLRVTAGATHVLFTGDIEARSEAVLLRDGLPVAADVVFVPHHGSRTSSTLAFVAAVAPTVAVVTAGYRNRFKHPRADIVSRYIRTGAVVRRTDVDGAITLDIDPHGTRVQAERERRERYWYDRPAPQG